jgi:predicted GIY-YIG superfamily endonuclease
LIWSQQLADRFTARKREVELKGWNRKKKLSLVAGLEKSEGITHGAVVPGEPFEGADRSRSG